MNAALSAASSSPSASKTRSSSSAGETSPPSSTHQDPDNVFDVPQHDGPASFDRRKMLAWPAWSCRIAAIATLASQSLFLRAPRSMACATQHSWGGYSNARLRRQARILHRYLRVVRNQRQCPERSPEMHENERQGEVHVLLFQWRPRSTIVERALDGGYVHTRAVGWIFRVHEAPRAGSGDTHTITGQFSASVAGLPSPPLLFSSASWRAVHRAGRGRSPRARASLSRSPPSRRAP
jgi:hypothetical protein